MKKDTQLLEPAICRTDGLYIPANVVGKAESSSSILGSLMRPQTDLEARLHNENSSARDYPLRVQKDEFFSEALSVGNSSRTDYLYWIGNCLDVIKSKLSKGVVPYTQISDIGREIADQDASFVKSLQKKSIDELHSHYGPNKDHPYRKITLARSCFPLDIDGEIEEFFYEKYLVVYSFENEKGNRQGTVTPIHGHPP